MTGKGAVPAPRIRNVLLLGHGGTGKTALAEALLAIGGVASGRGSILDFEPEEQERGHSLAVATASLPWHDHKINLLDAPGLPDAVGDAYPAMLAADVAVFVVDASVGIQPQHDELWTACAELGLPRLVFLNKLDRENAAFQTHVDALRLRYGKPLAPVHMPVGVQAEFEGVIDLLHAKAVVKREGQREEVPIPEERREQAERNREALVEAIVEVDDDLLERYLEGDVPEAKELETSFARGIATCAFFPVLCGSATLQIGVRLLADFIIQECPSPADRGPAVGADGSERTLDGPPSLYVAKTMSDPYVGRVNVMRVLTGGLANDTTLTVARTGATVRLHQLFTLAGKEQTPITEVAAGDLVAAAKLDDVATGDTLHAKDAPFALAPAPMPEPFHRIGVAPQSAGDEDKLSTALQRLLDEDPALRVERDADTNQLILRALGPTHVDVTLARMQRKFGVSVRQVPVRVGYRETLAGRGEGLGRHVKQTGGHGQYGVAQIEVEPLERGGGFEFADRIVGGVIPNQFIPSVEKGIRETMARGVLAGYPVVDVRVALVDGKHHSVDSSQVAFETAGSLAFRDAAQKAGIVLLEPILDVEVTVPDDLTGDVMGDLSSRRGRIQGTDQARPGSTTVRAHVPEAEMLGYVGELRSLTSGQGTLTMRYDHHEEVPANIADKVVTEAQQADD
jgi:elongation factor G